MRIRNFGFGHNFDCFHSIIRSHSIILIGEHSQQLRECLCMYQNIGAKKETTQHIIYFMKWQKNKKQIENLEMIIILLLLEMRPTYAICVNRHSPSHLHNHRNPLIRYLSNIFFFQSLSIQQLCALSFFGQLQNHQTHQTESNDTLCSRKIMVKWCCWRFACLVYWGVLFDFVFFGPSSFAFLLTNFSTFFLQFSLHFQQMHIDWFFSLYSMYWRRFVL